MGQDAVERFLGRIITDDAFREMAKESFLEACLRGGFVFTEREVEILRRLDLDKFRALSDELDRRLKRGACPVVAGSWRDYTGGNR
ncbi:MAG: Franean1_4349 family RiPP [Nitrospirae bacterium]|nr:Franean1_4349 family RiPP [Nitrospirota bacterium]